MASTYQVSGEEALQKSYDMAARSIGTGAFGSWKDCKITVASDDDLTAAVDLGSIYDYMAVYVPTLTAADLSLHSSETLTGTYYQVGLATNVVAAATGDFMDVWNLGGLQYIKIATSAGQAADRTFRVRGIRL